MHGLKDVILAIVQNGLGWPCPVSVLYLIPELPSNLNVRMVVVIGFATTSPIKDGKPLFWM